MINFEYKAAQRLACDIRTTHQAIDEALSDLASLACSVIEASRTSDAPPSQTQAAIESVAIGLTKLVDARKGFVAAHREIAVAHRNSNLQEINFGCFGDKPVLPSADLLVVNG